MLLLDQKYSEKEIYAFRETSKEYTQAKEKYLKALNSGSSNEIDDAVVFMETLGNDVVYKKGFHDGLKLILRVMAGKEIINLNEPKMDAASKSDTAIVGVEKGLREALYALVELEEVLNS